MSGVVFQQESLQLEESIVQMNGVEKRNQH